ncbi:MAG: subclass B1 metallo-beta-lactamase [Flavobacteriales bacterium]|nr:MAG: subclass B1 metallo-beta-lactamase [Flavobacteriales bacterium]
MRSIVLLALPLLLVQCTAPTEPAFVPKEVRHSAGLVVVQVSPNAFVHTSYKQTQDFGNVPCNGLVVRSGGEAIVFDTPTNDSVAAELIGYVQDSLGCRINAVIPTHFHDDCLGGLKAFHAHGIPSYAHQRTIALAAADSVEVPQRGFTEPLTLKVGTDHITATFHGEGHTKDNVVGYFANEQVLFGGCLIKELDASKGYLGDANVADWSLTVEAVKKAYPDVKVVVPGHGQYGDGKLLDYTIGLFRAAP